MIGKKYYVHKVHENLNDLENIASKLQSSNYVYTKKYFDDESNPKELELRTKFSGITTEENILQGVSNFEIDQSSTDLEGRFSIARQAVSVKFFIALNPIRHVIFIADSSGLATTLSRRMGSILSDRKGLIIPRHKLTDPQILKFLGKNKYTMKSVFRGTTLDGVNTMGLFGTDVEKPPEVDVLKQYLTDHKSIKVLLLDYGWTIWISKNTGAITSMDKPDDVEFVEFIQEKILTL